MSSVAGASLTAAFRVAGDRLEIRYTVQNGNAGEMYVFDAAVHVGPRGDAAVDTAVPQAEGQPDGVVLVFDKLLPLPPGTTTATPRSAYANRLGPGESHTRTVSVPLPLRDRRLAKGAQGRATTSARIRFELGVVVPAPDLYPEEQVINGVKVWRLNTAAYRLQQVLRTEATLSTPVAIEAAE